MDSLLDLDGYIIDQGNGYWVKIEAAVQEPYGSRIIGYDNAHAVKSPKSGMYAGWLAACDHKQRHARDKVVPYNFVDAYQLLKDFFADVDRALEARRKG